MLLKLGINEAIICVDFDYDTIGNNKEWDLFQKKVYKIADLLLPYVDKVTALVEYRTHPLKSSPSDLGKKELFSILLLAILKLCFFINALFILYII